MLRIISVATADTTYDPELQKFTRPLLNPYLSDTMRPDVATLYSSLEYFDWQNQQQDNVLGSPCTPFVSTAEPNLGGQVLQVRVAK